MSKEIDLNSTNFEKEVSTSDKPVFIDFWASWCAPCRMAAPIVEEIANEYDGKIKVCKCNIDDNPDISEKFNINSIPTFVVFNKGKEVSRSVGLSSKEGLIKLFKDKI